MIDKKKKILIACIAVFACALTLIILISSKKPEEEPPAEFDYVVRTEKYAVFGCSGTLNANLDDNLHYAFVYLPTEKSGDTPIELEVPEGSHALLVSCSVKNYSGAPTNFLPLTSGSIFVGEKEYASTVYIENLGQIDIDNIRRPSKQGNSISKGESTVLWFVSFVPDSVASGDDDLTLKYKINSNNHEFNIRSSLKIQ